MRARGDDEVWLETQELRREGGESLDLPRRPPVLNDEILALDPAALAQPVSECLPIPRDLRGGGRGVRENTDPNDLPRLLRIGSEWYPQEADGERGEEQGSATPQGQSTAKTRTAPPIIFMISETAV
jgi:hypothetical protein